MSKEDTISFRMALDSGEAKWEGNRLKIPHTSYIIEKLGHLNISDHKGLIILCNKPDKPAIKIGGTVHTLSELADALGLRIEDYQIFLPKKTRQENEEIQENEERYNRDMTKTLKLSDGKTRSDNTLMINQENEENEENEENQSLINVRTTSSDKRLTPDDVLNYFSYHEIEIPVKQPFFDIKYNERRNEWIIYDTEPKLTPIKRIFLDEEENKIKIVTVKGVKHTKPFPTKIIQTPIIHIMEGFTDCIKAIQDGCNAYTSRGGVNELCKFPNYLIEAKIPFDTEIVIQVDSDKAGQEALPKIIDAFLKAGYTKLSAPILFPVKKEKGEPKDYCDYRRIYSKDQYDHLVKDTLFTTKRKSNTDLTKSSDDSNHAEFWDIDDKGRYTISLDRYIDFLQQHGYTKVFQSEGCPSTFVHISDNIVSHVTNEDIKTFVIKYIHDKGVAVNELIKGKVRFLFGRELLETMLDVTPKFHKDTKDSCYFYFQNCFVEVTRDRYSIKVYKEDLDGYIWKKEIIQRNFSEPTLERPLNEFEFGKFLHNIVNHDKDRLTAILTAIGYLLSRYKNPSQTKAVTLVDERISDTPEGRTGKSIIATAISHLRNAILIDGKTFSFDSSFCYQQVNFDTNVIVFDDVTKHFYFEKLFHAITSDITVEKKHQHGFQIPFKESPKFLLTTNYTIKGEGGSFQDRISEHELYPHYNDTRKPKDEFGRQFFDDWNEDDWNNFHDVMFTCVSFYLKYGLETPTPINLPIRKLVDETCMEFVDYMDDWFSGNVLGQYAKEYIYEPFIEQNGEYLGKVKITKNRFTTWLKKYCKMKGIRVTEIPVKIDGKTERRVVFDRL